MTTSKPRGAVVVSFLGALFVLLLVVPTAVSVGNGDGAICLARASCPLSALNPCVRKPSFAVVGRCAVDIR